MSLGFLVVSGLSFYISTLIKSDNDGQLDYDKLTIAYHLSWLTALITGIYSISPLLWGIPILNIPIVIIWGAIGSLVYIISAIIAFGIMVAFSFLAVRVESLRNNSGKFTSKDVKKLSNLIGVITLCIGVLGWLLVIIISYSLKSDDKE